MFRIILFIVYLVFVNICKGGFCFVYSGSALSYQANRQAFGPFVFVMEIPVTTLLVAYRVIKKYKVVSQRWAKKDFVKYRKL